MSVKNRERRVLQVIVCILVLLCQSLFVSAAGTGITLQLVAADYVNPGEHVLVSVEASGAGITDGKATITYDESMLIYQGSELNYATEESKLEFIVNASEPGKVVIVWATFDAMVAEGAVFTLDFLVKEDASIGSTTHLDLTEAYANDATGSNIYVGEDGSKPTKKITIGEAPVVTEAPATEVPSTETPATETPSTETPSTETPATETPATETPTTETPSTETPSTDSPATATPVVNGGDDDLPKTGAFSNPTTWIYLVGGSAIIGCGVMLVVNKKKEGKA